MSIDKLKAVNWRDLITRALKTFIQAFLSSFTIDSVFDISNADMLKRFLLSTGISALAAGISATWNFIMELVSEKASDAIDKLNDAAEPIEPTETEGEESGDV